MSSATTLGRRTFLSIPIGVGMAAAGVSVARPAFAAPMSTAWVLSTTWSAPRGAHGRVHCNCTACQSHSANKIFATETDAGAMVAHVGCLCVPTPHAIATTTYQQLFASAVMADRRDPATLAILIAAPVAAPVSGPTPSPDASPSASPAPTPSPVSASPVSTDPASASPAAADPPAASSVPSSSAHADATSGATPANPGASSAGQSPIAAADQQEIEPAAVVVTSPTATPSASVASPANPSASALVNARGITTSRPRAAGHSASHGSLALWLPLPIVAATAALGGLIWLRNRGAVSPVQATDERPPGAHRATPPQVES